MFGRTKVSVYSINWTSSLASRPNTDNTPENYGNQPKSCGSRLGHFSGPTAGSGLTPLEPGVVDEASSADKDRQGHMSPWFHGFDRCKGLRIKKLDVIQSR